MLTHARTAAQQRCGAARVALASGALVALIALAAPASARGVRARRLTKALETELAALSQLDDLSRRVVAGERRLRTLRFQQTQLDDRIAEGERRIRAFDKRRAARRLHLRRRLRALYKLSRGGLLRLMLESDSADQARRQTRAVSRILARDAAELRLFRGALGRLSALRLALKKRRAEQAQLLVRAKTERARLRTARDALAKALESLRRDRRRQQRAAKALSYVQKRLLRRSSELRYKMRIGQSGEAFADRKGRLPRPTRGWVVSCFGAGNTHNSGVDVAHSGMLVRPRKRARVRAVADGRVVHAGPLTGFGQVVLIDHGAGYFTLNAHLGALDVRRGARVKARAQIGRVGLDPLSGKPSLYFELRHHRRPLDPSKWLARRYR